MVESVWNPVRRRSETKVVHNCGRADDPAVAERLRRLAKSILRRCSPEEIVAEDRNWTLVDAWPHGDLYVLEQLWQRLGLAEIIEAEAQGRQFEFSVERALFALVANRALAPCSKLYCFEQWLREDVRIGGTGELGLHQLYRAMAFLGDDTEDQTDRTPVSPRCLKDLVEEDLFHAHRDLFSGVDLLPPAGTSKLADTYK